MIDHSLFLGWGVFGSLHVHVVWGYGVSTTCRYMYLEHIWEASEETITGRINI